MAFSLDNIFTTRTALPAGCGPIEIEPCAALKPYIRCFWTYARPDSGVPVRIIPDCCADIIIDLDRRSAVFVDTGFDSFFARSAGAVFGIRFYAWAVSRFSRADGARGSVDPEQLFDGFSDFRDRIVASKTVSERIDLAQSYLTGILDERCDGDVMNCLYGMIKNNGNVSVSALASDVAVSRRTLERKFLRIGIAARSIARLIRYQLLWQECLKADFSALDCVEKFGYYDQAHMYNDFRAFHGLNPVEARKEYSSLSHFYNTRSL